jgi:hypothetical protein
MKHKSKHLRYQTWRPRSSCGGPNSDASDFAANRFQKLRSVEKIRELKPSATPKGTGRAKNLKGLACGLLFRVS